MEKLISLAQVEQFIDEKIEICKKQAGDSDRHFGGMVALEQLKSELSSLPTEESGWIAFSEKCPEEEETVLAIWSDSRHVICTFYIKTYADTNKKYHVMRLENMQTYGVHNFIAWMPLPKPPLQ